MVWVALKVVLGGSARCPDNHDLSKCHRLYDLGRYIELSEPVFYWVIQKKILRVYGKNTCGGPPYDSDPEEHETDKANKAALREGPNNALSIKE